MKLEFNVGAVLVKIDGRDRCRIEDIAYGKYYRCKWLTTTFVDCTWESRGDIEDNFVKVD
jgi:hypothetical protein